jgi:hypothetical protein
VRLAVGDPPEDVGEVVAGNGPLEQARDLPVVRGEPGEPVGERAEVGPSRLSRRLRFVVEAAKIG